MSDRSPAAKVLTIMMTDVVGSTELRRTRGDRDADDMLGLQAAIVRDEVAAFGGRVRKSLGDGFLISFPSTVPAVRAAAAIQRALQEHNTANPQRAVEVRIGIHVGQVTERDGDLLGQAVHGGAGHGRSGRRADLDIRRGAQARRAASGLVLSRFRAVLAAWLSGALAAVRGVLERHRSGCPPIAMSARLTPFVERDAERASLRRLVTTRWPDMAARRWSPVSQASASRGWWPRSRMRPRRGDAGARGHCVEMSGAPPYLPSR